MYKNILPTIVILLLSVATFSYGKTISKKQDDNKNEAERIWEQAIRARGGRERLYTIDNIFIASKSKVQYSLLKNYNNLYELLIVFPDKEWSLDDNRPSVLGLTMRMYNFETGKMYLADTGQKEVNLQPIDEHTRNESIDGNGTIKWSGLAVYLPETKWFKPIPESVTSGKVSYQEIDIVQTKLNGKRIDFYFDKKSHLPARIIFYNYYPASKEIRLDKSDLSDYVKVNGIIMPTKLRNPEESGVENLTYQFNVKYNNSIFSDPPLPAESAVDAWNLKN